MKDVNQKQQLTETEPKKESLKKTTKYFKDSAKNKGIVNSVPTSKKRKLT